MTEITLREHMSRIGKLGTGKSKRRSKEHYQNMGRRRWEVYREEKKLLAKAIAAGFCAIDGK